jgi:hypothetical protein
MVQPSPISTGNEPKTVPRLLSRGRPVRFVRHTAFQAILRHGIVKSGSGLTIGLIRKWEPKSYAIFGASYFRDVTFAADIFDQVDMPGFDVDLFASGDFNLSPAAERDHVLAAWSGVPIGNRTGQSTMKLGSSNREHLEHIASELRFDLFGVSLIVWAGVQTSHCHRFVGLSEHHAMPSEC